MDDAEKRTLILELFFLLIKQIAEIPDKLGRGEIKVEDVDVRKWIALLNDLPDLKEANDKGLDKKI